MKKPVKIITHDGIFHADEVFAIALISTLFDQEFEIVRTRNILPEWYSNPDVWVIDVGGKYDPEMGNFDHHHDESLPASCMLMFYHLIDMMSEDLSKALKDTLSEISHIDCKGLDGANGFQVNSLIKNLNSLDNGFTTALSIGSSYMQSCIENAKEAEKSLFLWNTAEKIGPNIRIVDGYPINWKSYPECRFLIFPDKGKYTVLSSNSALYPLVQSYGCEFIHKGKFIAVYADAIDAIKCAMVSDSCS